ELARALHEQLKEALYHELYDVAGPRIKPPEQFKKMVLSDPKITSAIEQLSEGNPERREELRKKAYDMLDEIAAEPRIRWPLALDRILRIFWKRMYEGEVYSEQEFEKIRQALRKGPVVLCPSHKSHVDYLIFSQTCVKQAVPLPHIAAGVNLSFWPMGPFFRHSGAFFLRRSFKGDKLYPVVFRTYLRYVMAEGFPIEFFIEGTRSRTGKLLNPKYGILSWLVEAYQEGTAPDIQFFPISIDYEKLVESRSYVKELSGGEKRKEDVAALVKSSEHLRSKYGKIYIQVADPISLNAFLEERGLDRQGMNQEARRRLVQELAYSILYRINEVQTVTPSAVLGFCLLNHRRRSMEEAELMEQGQWVVNWIRRRGHERFSYTLDDFPRAIQEAAARFARDGLISVRHTGEEAVYAPVEERRLELDYYRNNIIHHFVPAAIVTTCLESFGPDAVPLEKLAEKVRALSRLFKFEFLFRSERDFDAVLERALGALEAEGAIAQEGELVAREREGLLRRLAFGACLEHFLEGYWMVASQVGKVAPDFVGMKQLVARLLSRGSALYMKGQIQYREALNREIVKNALQVLAEDGVVEAQTGRKESPSYRVSDSKAAAERADWIWHFIEGIRKLSVAAGNLQSLG
ncbi:MAG: hypothetical protein D6806_05045, partial [Deltaproteobacteria bacterium]